MTITAKTLADSVSPAGDRLTTLELRYPRFIHAEVLTHRVFSRNASSSRAVPVARLIQDVIDDPAMPMHWGKNQPGMQARVEMVDPDKACAQDLWEMAREQALDAAESMADCGAHKQIVNRLLEPFAHINVVLTGTEFDNFFALRDHPDAQPEIQALAQAMRAAMEASTPQEIYSGQWHLPYVSVEERDELFDWCGGSNRVACQVSAARCARVSYLTHEGQAPDRAKDQALFAKLAGVRPQHLSPTEHQATPAHKANRVRNLRGWQTFRTELEAQ